MNSFTVTIGTKIQRLDGTRTFEIVAMRAQLLDAATQYERVDVEVDMRNIETGELHEYITVGENFFARYVPLAFREAEIAKRA